MEIKSPRLQQEGEKMGVNLWGREQYYGERVNVPYSNVLYLFASSENGTQFMTAAFAGKLHVAHRR